ncbi:MAG TPA: sigma 54-interacting transcriptional regulator [bacterium]|nr:sigma 54-interacting transcriptional regulator [bacterium]HPR88035.1 sigma 54-interacting transcriptional regulator [bacterium]
MKAARTSAGALLAAVALLFTLLALWRGSWRTASEDWSSDFYLRLRGDRSLDARWVFIAVTAEDVYDLGGWPVTRDYYSYLLHTLQARGARILAFDLLMESPQRGYPEFDRIFADALASAGTVCLPMAFETFQPPVRGQKLFQAGQPTWPHPLFRDRLAGCGFSNLPPSGMIRRLPVLAAEADTLRLSFGAEMARQFWGGRAFSGSGAALVLHDDQGNIRRIPLDGNGQLRIDPVSGKRIEQLNFVHALHMLRDQPGALDLTGRIVLVGVTAPGLAVSKSTVLNAALPAPLLQLIAAENIISGRWLAPLPVVWQILLVLLLCAACGFIARRGGSARLALGGAALGAAVLAGGRLLFLTGRILPLVCPLGALATAVAALSAARIRRERSAAGLLRAELQSALEKQHLQLQAARAELAGLLKQRHANGEDEALFAKQQEIAGLEKRIADIRSLSRLEREKPQRKYDMLYHPDSPLAEVVRLIELLAAADLAVILQGETGTGKELAARAIHAGGARRDAPFLAVNCSALSATLLESELFGHEKGSFTGAIARRRGLFEQADGGTLFLDEISETSPAFQAKLLRVLQEKTVQPLGGERPVKVDVRIIAAANRDLQALARQQEFREDLFYRLNGMTLTLPPLRQRVMDIPLLADHFLGTNPGNGRKSLAADALALLTTYAWPGNIRELDNVLQRAALLATAAGRSTIQSGDLPEALHATRPAASTYLSLEEQILHSLRSLRFSHASIALTAQALGGRDRGTITEYLRGICFMHLVAADYRMDPAIRALTASDDPVVLARAGNKMRAYIANLSAAGDLSRLYQGLPQKYHPYLRLLLEHRDRII